MAQDSTASAPVPAHSGHPAPAVPRTRAGSAWVLACVAAVVLFALIVFVAQNVQRVELSFLGWHGDVPLAVVLLAAALLGSVLTLGLGSTRIIQLRLAARRVRREAERTPSAP